MANERLRQAILSSGLSLDDVAIEVQADAKTIERWITQGRVPHPRNRAKMAQALGVEESALWPQIAEARAKAVVGSEVLGVYPYRGAVPAGYWYELLASAQQHVDILVYAGLFLSDGRADLPALFESKADEGVAIRMLLGDPRSDAVGRRGAEEQIGDALAARIRMSMTYLEPALKAPAVDARVHATTLYNSIFRFDDDLLVNMHAYGAVAAQSPVMHVRRIAGGRLFAHYLSSFERVWEEARPLDDAQREPDVVAA